MSKSKRRAKSAREMQRRSAFREVPDRVLIVTEGSKTEPAYFRMLIAELGLTTAKVTIVGDGGSALISVVEEAEKRLKQDDDFEQIYCVFDRDRHASYAQALEALRGISARRGFKAKTILAIPSVPCFELWYLLHVSDSRKPYENAGSPGDALIADLKKISPFEGYNKKDCQDFFSHISASRNEAKKRAARHLKAAQDEGAQEFQENPSTRVHLVVGALTEIARKK